MNIEKTISEHAVSDILTPMLASQDRIVTEDVAPLFDAATGLDTPTASGTVTTTIEAHQPANGGNGGGSNSEEIG